MAPDGQVCDRCRQKKVKCDGVSDATASCSNCSLAGVPCQASAKLRRKTKFRGYEARGKVPAIIEKLEKENSQLRDQIRRESDLSHSSRQELNSVNPRASMGESPTAVRSKTDVAAHGASRAALTLSEGSEAESSFRSASVIKHMGRMVHDQANTGRFAGSTTGVHFVASMEELCRRACPDLKPFPEACFRMYLTERVVSDAVASSGQSTWGSSSMPQSLSALFDRPAEYYVSILDRLNDIWLAFCPIVVRSAFAADVKDAIASLRRGVALDGNTLPTVHILLTVMLIDRHVYGHERADQHDPSLDRLYLVMARELQHLLFARGDLPCLQSLALFSFYLLITNTTCQLMHMSGALVRLAHSLGMHRHSRRFRFTDGVVELRKRIWWWIYSFDQYTALIHGLPRLLQDADIDNDLPIDCELDDSGQAGLSHPLPGEPTPVSVYIHYVQLSKIVSAMLGQLYTTTQRREGEEKILNLDRDLRGWHQNLCSALRIAPTLECAETLPHKARLQRFLDCENFTIAWLDLMANYALVLIHRPALTFDKRTTRFRESLNVAVKASAAIIRLADCSSFHRRAIDCAPFGPAVIFQSALMQIFNVCLGEFGVLAALATPASAIVDEAVRLLQAMRGDSHSDESHPDSLGPSIDLLRTLSMQFLETGIRNTEPPESEPLPTNGHSGQSEQPSVPIEASGPAEREHSPFDLWNSSALWSLNNLDTFDFDWESAGLFDSDMT